MAIVCIAHSNRGQLLVVSWPNQPASILLYKYPSSAPFPTCCRAWWEEASVF